MLYRICKLLVGLYSRGISFDSAWQWRRVVTDGLAGDDVDVTMTCQIICTVGLL